MNATDFIGEGGRDIAREVVDATNLITFVFQVASHVGAHAPNTDEADFLFFCTHVGREGLRITCG